MVQTKPHSPRLIVVAASLVMVVASHFVRGQEVSTAVDDRVEPVEIRVPEVPQSKKGISGWDLAAVISAAYDDNIYLSANDATSDVVLRAGPAVAYRKGDPVEGEGGFVKVAYQPQAVIYLESNGDNRIDHQAEWLAGWRGKASKVAWSGSARKLGDATADTGQKADRVEFENVIRFAWIPREKLELEISAGNARMDYEDPGLFDSSKVYGEAAVRFAYSPKTKMALVYQIGRFQVDGAGDQNSQQLTGGIDWQPREKIRVNLEAGAEYRKFDNGSDTNPVVKGRVDWQPREGTGLFLSAYQREEASAYLAGQNYRLRGFTAGISQKLGGKWTALLEGGRESATYKTVSGSGDSGREDRIWFLRPAVAYQLTENFDMELFYRLAENQSNLPDTGYSQRVAGVLLNYKF